MNQTSSTLKAAEELIRNRFPEFFGDRYRIDHIESSSFKRKSREINYITVYLGPDCPPLDHSAASHFDLLIKEELTGLNMRDWPAIAFVPADSDSP